MGSPLRRLAIAVLAIAVVSPASARASDDARKQEAQEHFQRGVKSFGAQQWDAALAEFLRSRELYPTRSATYDAALCLKQLGRYDEALEMFETLLRSFPNLPEEDKREAQRDLVELRAHVGAVDVQQAEPGAAILVDGRDRGVWPPAAPLRVLVGSHVVRVFREGFLPFEKRVEVASGQTVEVVASLRRLDAFGKLRVAEQSGRTLDVIVDGVVVGKTPWEGPLSLGPHTVFLRGEGDLGTQPVSVPVERDKTVPVTLNAEPLDSVLRVEPEPRGASVAIDGVVVGRGVWEGRLRASPHRLEVASEGFMVQARDVATTSGQRAVVAVPLERDTTSPMWRAVVPPRVVFDADAGLALGPSLGGDLVGSCDGACSRALATGAAVRAHGGYEFSSGIGIGLGAGYVNVRQSVEQQPARLQPVGLPSAEGAAENRVVLSGATLGGAAWLHRGARFPLLVRLDSGILLGSVRAARSGTFAASGGAASASPAEESATASYVYIAPEARVGWRFLPRFEASFGVQAMVLLALSVPEWKDERRTHAPPLGLATYGAQKLTGSVIALAAPSLGLRWDF
ncbi:MAG: PEGA domain-containing protein [Labilithrix sp.]|nr:PEGA domain-containing protein [Labilithrix sp.]MCW5816665.1 PEGA domain-containing protein [Labilithrix sp.]